MQFRAPPERGAGDQGAEFSDAAEDDFTDFLARTRASTTRLAFVLTGSPEAAAELTERAYAGVRARWRGGDESWARRALRDQVLLQARRFPVDESALEALSDSSWPLIPVSSAEVEHHVSRRRSRRGLLAAGALGLSALAVGSGVWRLMGRSPVGRQPDPATGAEFTLEDSQTVPLGPVTLSADLLVGPTASYVAVRRGDLVLGTLDLLTRQVVRLSDPLEDFGDVVVTISEPVSWMHVHGPWHDPLRMTMVDVAGRCVGLARTASHVDADVMVGGGIDGQLLAWPEHRVTGWLFGESGCWLYLVDGQLLVRDGSQALRAHEAREEPGVQVTRLQDGSLAFAVWSWPSVPLRLAGPGAASVLRRQSRRTGWVGLRPPGDGTGFPTMTWQDWQGRDRSLVLDDSL